jgi:hypothetical protein
MNTSAHNDEEEEDTTFNELDMENLLKAVDSDDSDYLLHLTTKKIQELNLNILKELGLPKKDTLDMLKQLTAYKRAKIWPVYPMGSN